MTINELICHNLTVPQIYHKYFENRLVSITEASKEPLTIGQLHHASVSSGMKSEDGTPLTFGEAMCFCCIENLISKYRRRELPDRKDKCSIAAIMVLLYKHWTVLDLPTFVYQCAAGKVLSYVTGVMSAEIPIMDAPNILAKLEAYDRMRPNPQLLQGSSPAKEVVKPLTKHKLTHLVDGTPYDFKVPYDDFVHGYVEPSGDPQRNAELYWRSRPNFDVDYADQCFDAKANYRQPIVKTVNETLGIK